MLCATIPTVRPAAFMLRGRHRSRTTHCLSVRGVLHSRASHMAYSFHHARIADQIVSRQMRHIGKTLMIHMHKFLFSAILCSAILSTLLMTLEPVQLSGISYRGTDMYRVFKQLQLSLNDESSNPWYLPNAVVSADQKSYQSFFSRPGCLLKRENNQNANAWAAPRNDCKDQIKKLNKKHAKINVPR